MSRFNDSQRKLALTTIALASSVACLSAQAQQQAPVQLQRIEITGSNIKRLATETASPVQVYSRTEIKETGANTVRQVLDTIMATDAATTLRDNNSSSSFAAGASGVGMRGLGKAATLVLLNGRRLPAYGLADGAKETFANIDALPADVIDRVEVLKDGASAVYGSDAMAGVINIITRREYEGVGMSAAYQYGIGPSINKQTTVGLVAGKGDFARDRYNVLANLELYKRDGYFLSDVKDDYAPWHKQFVSPAFGDPVLTSWPGNLIKGSINAKGDFVPGARVANKDCPASQKNSAGACAMDVNGLNMLSAPAKRANFYSAGRYAISDTVEAFAEVSGSHVKVEFESLPFAISAPGTPYQWFDGNAKKIQIVKKPLLSASNPANTTGGPAGLEYRFMDNPNMWHAPVTASQYRVMAGLKGTFGTWDWETAVGRVGASASKKDVAANRDTFISAVSTGEYKVGGQNSQELLDKMFNPIDMRGDNHQNFLDAKVSGEVMQLPAGPLQMAAGLDIRGESMKVKSSDNVMAAQMIGRGSVWVEGKRNLFATFAEFEGPIVKNLVANAALRYDKADGFSGHMSPKLGLRWTVNPKLLLRGTVAGGFRAPNIPETLGKVGLTGFYNNTMDPKRCADATAIQDILKTGNANDKQDATTAYNSGCLASVPAMISANPNLKPELSRSYTAGFVFEPVKDLSVAVDLWRIERRDEISTRDRDYVLAREGQPGYTDLIARQPISTQDQAYADRANQLKPGANVSWKAGQLITLLLQYENFGKTESSGIDLDVKGKFSVADLGTFTLGLQTTYALKSRSWDIDADDWRPNTVGLRNTPRTKARLSAQWKRNDWSAGLAFSYTSRMELNNDETDEATWSESACRARLKPGSYVCYNAPSLYTDFNLSYSGFKNTRVGLNVNNLLHDSAPVNLRDGYAVRPRYVRLSAEYKF